MSTNDVPGENPSNKDKLAMGCWAESDDGSLIFVKANEGKRVVFEIYEMTDDPITKYTTAMPEAGFKKEFTWSSGPKLGKWTWHDKTPFPWDRVIEAGVKEGTEFASVEGKLSDTQRTIESLIRRGLIAPATPKPVSADDLKHLKSVMGKPSARSIADKIQKAIESADVGTVNEQIAELRKLDG